MTLIFVNCVLKQAENFKYQEKQINFHHIGNLNQMVKKIRLDNMQDVGQQSDVDVWPGEGIIFFIDFVQI